MWQASRRKPLDRCAHGPNMVWRRAAATPEDVDEARLGELAKQSGRIRRPFVVLAKRVRQAGIGIAGHMAFGDAREFGEIRPHLFGAERAIQANAEGPGVPNGHVEGVDHLA